MLETYPLFKEYESIYEDVAKMEDEAAAEQYAKGQPFFFARRDGSIEFWRKVKGLSADGWNCWCVSRWKDIAEGLIPCTDGWEKHKEMVRKILTD